MAKPISRPNPIQEKPDSYSRYLPHFILIALAFVLYCNTLFYGYVLDDAIVIKDNAFTKKGFDGLIVRKDLCHSRHVFEFFVGGE